MKLTLVNRKNKHIYLNLAQGYEAEFSKLTSKKADANGIFLLDTELGGNTLGYLCYLQNAPSGLAAVRISQDSNEVCEFYISPHFRRQGYGAQFAHEIWRRHPGDWEIKQIAGAHDATAFWRRTINAYNNTGYQEDDYDDPYWGAVRRQRFRVLQAP